MNKKDSLIFSLVIMLFLQATHRVLVRYPEGPAHLAASQDAALADGTATHLIDTPFDLIALMRTHDQRKNS